MTKRIDPLALGLAFLVGALQCPGCQYSNLGTALGTSPCGLVLSDTDPSHHWVALPD
jgi:hypothetical protein